MTVASLFSDMILIGVFMLAGFFVREIVKPIQKLFLPASLIGGLLALILGQQMFGLVEIPESFSKFSNVLIAPIMAALLFGVTINKKKVVGYMDYICVEQGIYGMQMCVGAGLGALLAVIWPGLPKGWGTMGVFAFQGGHGNAGAAGQTYENLGIPGNMSIGMVLATFGLIMAMLVGMIVVNIGVRKGWTKFVKDAQKISVCMELPHQSGSLYNALAHFIYNDLNMTKIESRPIPQRKWEYRFFVDFEGNLSDPAVKNALRGLQAESAKFRIFGNY